MMHLLSEEGFIDGHLAECARTTRRAHGRRALGCANRGHWTAEARIMGQCHTAQVVAVGAGMGGDERALLIARHGLPCPSTLCPS
jgi:hypothetical protein